MKSNFEMFVSLFVCLCLATVAMGRCQSTPGLVETKGRISIEDMWLHPSTQPTCYNQQSLIRYLIWLEYHSPKFKKKKLFFASSDFIESKIEIWKTHSNDISFVLVFFLIHFHRILWKCEIWIYKISKIHKY